MKGRLQMREALAQTHAERDLLKIQLKRNENKWASLTKRQREEMDERVDQVRAAAPLVFVLVLVLLPIDQTVMILYCLAPPCAAC